MDCNLLNSVLPILGVIIGAIIGYLSSLKSVELQNKLIEEKENRQLKREKLEKTYSLTIEAKHQQRKLYSEALLYIEADQDFNIDEPDKDSLPLHELDLMINLYMPELKDNLSDLHLRAQVFDKFFIELSNSRLKSLSDKEEQKLHDGLKQSFDELEEEFKKFMQKLTTYSKQI